MTIRTLTSVHRVLVLLLFTVVTAATLLASQRLAAEAVCSLSEAAEGNTAITQSLYLAAAMTLDQPPPGERIAIRAPEPPPIGLAGSVQSVREDLDEWSQRALLHLYLYTGIGLCLALACIVAIVVLTPHRLIRIARTGLDLDRSDAVARYPSRARRASYALRWT